MRLTRFLQLKEGTSREQGLIRLVIIGLLAGLLAEGYLLAQARFQERVILVPLLEKPVELGWNSSSPEYLEALSRQLLPLVTTYHPRTIDRQINDFLKYVAPESYGAIKAQLLLQAEEAKKSELSQVFYLMEDQIEGERVRMTGLIRRFIGKTQTSEEVTVYEVCYAMRHGRAHLVGLRRVGSGGQPDRRGKGTCHGEGERPGLKPD